MDRTGEVVMTRTGKVVITTFSLVIIGCVIVLAYATGKRSAEVSRCESIGGTAVIEQISGDTICINKLSIIEELQWLILKRKLNIKQYAS